MASLSSVPTPPLRFREDVLVVGKSAPSRAVEAHLRKCSLPVRAVPDVAGVAQAARQAADSWRAVLVMTYDVLVEAAAAGASGKPRPEANSSLAWRPWVHDPRVSILVLYEAANLVKVLSAAFDEWVSIPRVDFVRVPAEEAASTEWLNETLVRVCKLYASSLASDDNLFDPESGRYDAGRVAKYLGVPLSELSEALGAKYKTVHKTPASPSLQERLGRIGRTIDLLLKFHKTQEGVRQWLNTPHRELDERTPMSVILDGRAEVVRGMLESAYAGIPS